MLNYFIVLYVLFIIFIIAKCIYFYINIKKKEDAVKYTEKINSLLIIVWIIGTLLLILSNNKTIKILLLICIIILLILENRIKKSINKKLLKITNNNIKEMNDLYYKLVKRALNSLSEVQYTIGERDDLYEAISDLKDEYCIKYNLKTFKKVIYGFNDAIIEIQQLEEIRRQKAEELKKQRKAINKDYINNLRILELDIKTIDSINSEEEVLVVIKKHYKRLARKYHPDINKDINSKDKFIEITEAYNNLLEYYNNF